MLWTELLKRLQSCWWGLVCCIYFSTMFRPNSSPSEQDLHRQEELLVVLDSSEEVPEEYRLLLHGIAVEYVAVCLE